MKKVLQLFLALAITCSLPLYAAQLSNVIIFGDSLSDIGNFPETPTPFTTHIQPVGWKNLSPMFYVPVTNPMNMQGYSVNLQQVFPNQATHPYALPDLYGDHLTPQPTIIDEMRVERSISWSEFFVSDANQDGLLQSQVIIPSEQLESNPNLYANLYDSVDYAWASATTFNDCTYFKNYGILPKSECNSQSIIQARKNYMNDPTSQNYQNLVVPGTGEQINLFIQDVQSGKVQVGPNTAYIIYIGGNDLMDDYYRLASGNPFKIANALGNLSYWMSKDVYNDAYKLIHDPMIQAKNIYIVTLYDPAYTPYFQSSNFLTKCFLGTVDDYYDYLLSWDVYWLNTPQHQVTLVNGAQWFEAMHDRTGNYAQLFNANTIDQACEFNNINQYTGTITAKANCQGYLFWNSIHPATPAQEIFGFQTEQAVINSLQDTAQKTQTPAQPKKRPTFAQFLVEQAQTHMSKNKQAALSLLINNLDPSKLV